MTGKEKGHIFPQKNRNEKVKNVRLFLFIFVWKITFLVTEWRRKEHDGVFFTQVTKKASF